MSAVLQLFWHSAPVAPGGAVEQSKYVMGAAQEVGAGFRRRSDGHHQKLMSEKT